MRLNGRLFVFKLMLFELHCFYFTDMANMHCLSANQIADIFTASLIFNCMGCFYRVTAATTKTFLPSTSMRLFSYSSWYKQRQLMFINVSFAYFAFGLSLSIYYSTEYYYFKDRMKTENADLFYGLSLACLYASGVITSLLISYYADATKKIREIYLISNIVNIIGNVIYLLYYSPYIILFGQFLIGTASARTVAGVGEISRVYKVNKLTQKLSILGIFSALGAVTGPCTTYLFSLANFKVNGWILDINNMPGAVMGVLYIFQFFMNYFTLENVSKIHNLKEQESQNLLENIETEDVEQEESISKELTFREKYMKALSLLLHNKYILFLYALSFFTSFARATISFLQPIKTVEYLSWAQTELATFYLICIIFGVLSTAVIFGIISKSCSDFFMLLYTLYALLTALTLMGMLPIIASNKTMTTIFVYGNGIFKLSSSTGFGIITRSMLAKLVPEHVQTITEAIRNALFEMSFMIAGLWLHIPAVYLLPTMFIMAFILCFFMAWFVVEEKFYRNIKIITDNTK